MPQRCKICSHSKRNQIDSAILQNLAYTRIASEFEAHPKSVEYHAKKHLKPIVDQANRQAKQKIVKEIIQYRKEVNYSTLDKVKLLQEKIFQDLDAAVKIDEKVSLYRELRGALQEEAKLSGLYQREKENETESAVNYLKAAIERRAADKGVSYKTELQNYLDNFSANVKPEIKQRLISHANN